MAYLDAFTKLVTQLRGMDLNAKADNVSQSVTMSKPGKMYAASNLKAKVVRDLEPGMTLYPSGDKDGIWWKVTRRAGQRGLGALDAVPAGQIVAALADLVEPEHDGVRIPGAAAQEQAAVQPRRNVRPALTAAAWRGSSIRRDRRIHRRRACASRPPGRGACHGCSPG